MTRNHRDSQFWQWVIAQFRLGTKTSHGPRHWLTVLRNDLYLYQHHSVEIEVVRLFALFHDSCRHNEYCAPPGTARAVRNSPSRSARPATSSWMMPAWIS